MDKFLSRKFILALLSTILGVSVSIAKLDGKVGAIAAIVSAVLPSVIYIIAEGTIDAKAVTSITDEIVNFVKENEDDI